MTEPPPPTASQLRAAAAICSNSKAAGGPRLANILDAWARRLDRDNPPPEEDES